MNVGVAHAAVPADGNAVDTLIDLTRQAQGFGIPSIWFAQLFEHDALMTAALAGREVPGIRLGTAVVPMYPRHPLTVASQAQTAQAATHGRFSLGIGFGAPQVAESIFGTPWRQPIKHLREYLQVLHDVLHNGMADVEGETLIARTMMRGRVPGGANPPVPVVVGAMGPQALRATGEQADGTLLFLASPRALADFIVPTITQAAAGRPAPRVIAIVPAIATADPGEKRATAEQVMYYYNEIPSYRRVMELGGADGPADLATFGDEESIAAEVRRYFDAGATEVLISTLGLASDEEHKRTWQLVGELAKS
jgi:F420-dependent oxidoreductase-like protein